ncbi:2-oxo-4-hydroxy-4-carboxy-5-ureidoimidazoline decarboxylase [Leptothoe sp. PORK10 BA2]|uniref:2-oxo-4-hydroxy-4-carboxy-5-ureidoimidazoline decarboxylase n=1 Tax=Leptothoe sp. PORK10 BA2 TaxID=3110254 RepID=UPI002B218988|nr:2-oxo-4-hydroxy-4-carboxy-5-ureidoimidazoline decarboxylase [Leptothoe sp. PORK10 BA2]MEA5462595.1 2-oxo-4-hydroxy-4-carboxy-5-ureidoimidazoline decarboxylase [Leptothoe sp. PORK10 BA2]
MQVSIEQLNPMAQDDFIALLGHIFEGTPGIAEQVWVDRPFANVLDLHGKMVAIVEQMPLSQQIELIKAHPELGSRSQMADASVQEQASVGFNHISPSLYERLKQLNLTYRQKFGVPFVMAIKGQTREKVLAEFEHRLHHSKEQEIQTALREIAKIARFRLSDLVMEMP